MSDNESDAPAVAKRGRGRPAGPPKEPKELKKRGRKPGVTAPKPTHAPFTALVTNALTDLDEKKGSSKIAIVKYIMDKEPECSDKAKVAKSVKSALKRLVLTKVILAPKGTVGKFRFADKAKEEKKPKKKVKDGRRTAKKAVTPKKVKVSPKKVKTLKKSPKKSPKKTLKKTPQKAVPAKKTPVKSAVKGRGRPKKN